MAIKQLTEYEKDLYGCRFCPMCKPACETGGLTKRESLSTRGRALLLWRVAAGKATLNKRDAEIIYQTTLDTVSQAWCINNYPVGDYILAARRELVREGNLPRPVRDVLDAIPSPASPPGASTVLLTEHPGDGLPAELPALPGNLDAVPWITPTGRLPYILGDFDSARELAQELASSLKGGTVRKIVTDGPAVYHTLTVLFEEWDVDLPSDIEVIPLSSYIEKSLSSDGVKPKKPTGISCLVQDSRAAFYLADETAGDAVLQPALSDVESSSGSGEVFDAPRRVVEALGYGKAETVWSKALAKTSGADDALPLVYPELARGLAWSRIDQAIDAGAGIIACESSWDARMLNAARRGSEDPTVAWLPEIIASK